MEKLANLPFVTVAALVLSAEIALARPATCYLEVGGRAFIDGPCGFEPLYGDDGSFRVMAQDGLYFAYLSVDTLGHGIGHWNEEPGASHAHSPLGILKRDGACWIGKGAKLCAW